MKYFLIYDDETNIYKTNIERLVDSVKKYSDFEIILFKKSEIDNIFLEKNKNILNCKRGGGYWLWKPYIINKILKKINNDDSLFYLDSSYYFIENFTDLYKDEEILIFSNKPNENTNHFKRLCKMDVIIKYNMQHDAFIKQINECWAGAIYLKKNDFNTKIMEEWLEMCCIFEDITDTPSNKYNPFFMDHRHDQSLLTILITKYNIPTKFFSKKYLQNVRIPY